MFQSYCNLRDVSLKRSSAANRVIFLPHCGSWVRSSRLQYLIAAVMVAFCNDGPVIAVCQEVTTLLGPAADPTDNFNQNVMKNLLTFVSMYCFLNQLRMYVYADQLNALMEEVHPGVLHDYGKDFPFDIVRNSAVPFWHALGVVVVTTVSANNNVLDEERHFSPTHSLHFISRYTNAERDIFIQTLGAFIAAPNPHQIEAITDYSGLLPLECKKLFEFIRTAFQQQPIPPLAAAPVQLQQQQWWPLLQQWKQRRLADFNAMLLQYDSRNPSAEAVINRANAARALEMRLPMDAILPVLYDRRLIFHFKQDNLVFLDTLSPLVRLQVQIHYVSAHSHVATFEHALSSMLANTTILTNDAKGRMIEGYILHHIREAISQRQPSINITPMRGGRPWAAQPSRNPFDVPFDLSNAEVVDFPGDGLPAPALIGDLSRPKIYIPLRSNYPHFDLFIYQPGIGAVYHGARLMKRGIPTTLFRCSVTVSLAGHGFNAAHLDLATWQPILDPIIGAIPVANRPPLLTSAPYIWISKKDQQCPAAAVNQSWLLDLEDMAVNGFPMLAFVRLR